LTLVGHQHQSSLEADCFVVERYRSHNTAVL